MDITINNTNMKIENGKLIINIDSEIEKLLNKKNIVRLADVEVGTVINDKYVVVEHFSDGMTGVVRKKVLDKRMSFGNDNNWKNSKLKKYLEEEYCKELYNEFGENSVKTHEIDLLSMDGSDEYGIDTCLVSAMTFDRYRRYHQIIGNTECTEWLSTPYQTKENGDTTYVQYVCDGGRVDYYGCGWGGGAVRPFFVLKSSIFVTTQAMQ